MKDVNSFSAGEWYYSGLQFKAFLRQHNISYKQAAEAIGVNKNTVGKVVRGGNLNTHILLRICQVYELDIRDFFKQVLPENAETAYGAKSAISQVSIDSLTRSLEQLQNRIAELNEQLQAGYALLRKLRK